MSNNPPLSLAFKRYDWGVASGEWPAVDGFIYLDVDIGIAQGRVAKRGRCEESDIPSTYQEKLHNKHSAWMEALEAAKADADKEAADLAAVALAAAASTAAKSCTVSMSSGDDTSATESEPEPEPELTEHEGFQAAEGEGRTESPHCVGSLPSLFQSPPGGAASGSQLQKKPSFQRSSSAHSLTDAMAPLVSVVPDVLRLDCSRENSAAVVSEWLAHIDGFIAKLASGEGASI